MKLADFDVFPKLHEEYRRQTTSSGLLTIISILIMGYLFISQSFAYILDPPRQRLRVDDSPLPTNSDSVLVYSDLPKLELHLDILLPSLPCPFVNFAVVDHLKERHDDAFSRVKLKRIDPSGNIVKSTIKPKPQPNDCGSCYGASEGCCNSCKEVKRAFKAKGRPFPPLSTISQCRDTAIEYGTIRNEKCHVYGTVTVPRIKGVLYIAPGDIYGARNQHIADYASMGLTIDDFNLTHTINSFFVGENDPGDPGINGLSKIQRESGRYKAIYFASTIREKTPIGDIFRTRFHHYERYREGASGKFPGIFFFYDLSPVIVEWKRDVSFLHFLVNLMAILGGIYSLGIFLDRLLNLRGGDQKAKSLG